MIESSEEQRDKKKKKKGQQLPPFTWKKSSLIHSEKTKTSREFGKTRQTHMMGD